ncbi:hypothetical protein ACJMK2_032036 [Sinanodonta woodiana]|uniref:Uncharacterized protein n=1 Tax=Sinanodonta woodiana TaxID=1069815 RepID=A0ABD3X1Z4_SINWO
MSSHLLLLVYIVFYVVLHRGLGTVNFALHKSAVQSSTLNYNFEWTADKAVDGNNDGSNPNRIETCSSTDNTYEHHVNHTWEVNITQVIIVKTVTVYGRTDGIVTSHIELNFVFNIYWYKRIRIYSHHNHVMKSRIVPTSRIVFQ